VAALSGGLLSEARAQGCVAVRGGGMCGAHIPGMHGEDGGKWLVSTSYRFLHSEKHFVRSTEQPQRKTVGNDVVNDSHFIDFSVAYNFTPRYSASLALPFVISDRSAPYEHAGQRKDSSARGLGDVRVAGYVWLWDPAKMPKGNIQLGLGLKAPTGDYKATDTFYGPAATGRAPVTGYVDQSIQPGDGGWGFTLEMNANRQLASQLHVYGQAYYLFNPAGQNGTPTTTGAFTRGNPFEQITSVPDQYLARGGFTVFPFPETKLSGFSLSFGGRIEGVPVEDAIGDSTGFRRPGYAISVEPGVAWTHKKWMVNITVPVAVYRNRQRSVADKQWTASSGIFRRGDAAFADYLITCGIARRF
jgi:hypothetical protein